MVWTVFVVKDGNAAKRRRSEAEISDFGVMISRRGVREIRVRKVMVGREIFFNWERIFFIEGGTPFVGGDFYVMFLFIVFAFCWLAMRTKTLRAAHGIRGYKWGFPNVMLVGFSNEDGAGLNAASVPQSSLKFASVQISAWVSSIT